MILNNADNVMLGSDEVSKIYCGSVVVWERGGGILPPGYTQKKYLQSSGAQAIDTGYTPQTDMLRIEARIMYGQSRDKAIAQSRLFGLWTYTSLLYLYTNSNSNALFTYGSQLQNDQIFDFVAENSTTQKLIQIDETQYTNTNAATVADTSNPIYLFAGKYSNAQPISDFDYFYTGKMYYCKIYDNDVLVRDFIPAVRDSDSKPGFYDLVTDQFFVNAGTGADFTTN